MRAANDSGSLLAPILVAVLAAACCAGLPARAGVFAGVTLGAILGVGGGLTVLIAAAPGIVLFLRARRRCSLLEEAELMRVEVLYFDGCPNHEALPRRLRELLAHGGISSGVELRRITDDETAQRERFLGSPTVRVNGLDVEPDAERRTDYGIKCRLYRAAGDVSGQLPEEWLRAALIHATGAA
jgi:hypothetical protein